MQRAVIVWNTDENDNIYELNELLEDGWRVVSHCPFGSGNNTEVSLLNSCLVIVEK